VRPAAILASIALAPASAAQTPQGGWLIDVVGGPASPTNPRVTVRVSAWFDAGNPSFLAFTDGDFDLLGDTTGEFRNPVLLPVHSSPSPQPPGTTPGEPSSGNVSGVLTGQLFVGPLFPSTANPIPLWEAFWTTGDFTPRPVALETAAATTFRVYDHAGRAIQLYPHAFAHGNARITVVPAPATALLALAAALPRRRRGRAATDTR
jgi:hypothetical protein